MFEEEYEWEDQEFYTVEKILDHKRQGGKDYYLVKW